MTGRLGTRLLLVALTWAAAGLLLWLAARGADWSRAWQLARQAHGGWLVVAVASNLAILALWASLWRRFSGDGDNRAPWREYFAIAGITSAIMNTVPLLVGHASAVMLLVRRARVEPSRALSVLALDQLGEGLTKLAVFAAAALVVPLPLAMRAGGASISVAVGVLLVALLLVRHGGSRLAHLRWVGPLLESASRHLALLHRPRVAVAALGIALAMKGAEALAIAAVMRALDVPLAPQAALVVLAATNIATMLPVAPANLGAYEAAAAATYRWLGVAPDLALATAIVQHACFLVPAIGAGVVVLAAGAAGTQRQRT